MALTGGAAILARMRAQRAAAASGTAAADGAASAGGKAAIKPEQPEVTVLYASQTGTAQEIARDIQARAQQHGFKAKVMSFNECGFDNLRADKTPIVVAIASSTGDGDPPDNSAKTYQAMRRRSNPSDLLKGVHYTVLGLGDSNYTRFCYVPRSINKRFKEMGADQFYEYAEADEVDGIEATVDPYVDGLWDALRDAVAKASGTAPGANGSANGLATKVAGIDIAGVPPLPSCRIKLEWQPEASAKAVAESEAALAAGPSANQLAHRDPEGAYSGEAPFWAPVAGARYLTSPGSEKRVVHLELDVSGSGMRYRPGDSVGLVVRNDEQEVGKLLERLKLQPDAVFSVVPREAQEGGGGMSERLLPHLGWPCTVRHAFTAGVDIGSPPRKSLLRLLAEHCSDDKDKAALLQLCGREGKEAYAKLLQGQPTLLQLLERYPSCCPPLDALLDLLPSLAPRMYSVTTAPQRYPNQVHVAFSIVDFTTEFGRKRGVATTYLEAACKPLLDGQEQQQLRLPTFHRSGGAFHPPQDLSKPWIMIGPGTGVAPFRGFLQARQAALQQNGAAASSEPAWLFFGCRRRDEDYLYAEELQGFVKDGTLAKLEVAFSREQEKKVYVQHLMKKQGEQLFGMMEEGGYVFVCGDGAAMAKDVHACLQDIIVQHGGVEPKEAAEQLASMTQQGQYVRDIWS